MITQEERDQLDDSCAHIAATADGAVLYQHLIRTLLDCLPPGSESGALLEQSGRRNFARELIRKFEGQSGSGISSNAPGPKLGEPASTVSAGRRPRGAGRRVTTGMGA